MASISRGPVGPFRPGQFIYADHMKQRSSTDGHESMRLDGTVRSKEDHDVWTCGSGPSQLRVHVPRVQLEGHAVVVTAGTSQQESDQLCSGCVHKICPAEWHKTAVKVLDFCESAVKKAVGVVTGSKRARCSVAGVNDHIAICIGRIVDEDACEMGRGKDTGTHVNIVGSVLLPCRLGEVAACVAYVKHIDQLLPGGLVIAGFSLSSYANDQSTAVGEYVTLDLLANADVRYCLLHVLYEGIRHATVVSENAGDRWDGVSRAAWLPCAGDTSSSLQLRRDVVNKQQSSEVHGHNIDLNQCHATFCIVPWGQRVKEGTSEESTIGAVCGGHVVVVTAAFEACQLDESAAPQSDSSCVFDSRDHNIEQDICVVAHVVDTRKVVCAPAVAPGCVALVDVSMQGAVRFFVGESLRRMTAESRDKLLSEEALLQALSCTALAHVNGLVVLAGTNQGPERRNVLCEKAPGSGTLFGSLQAVCGADVSVLLEYDYEDQTASCFPVLDSVVDDMHLLRLVHVGRKARVALTVPDAQWDALARGAQVPAQVRSAVAHGLARRVTTGSGYDAILLNTNTMLPVSVDHCCAKMLQGATQCDHADEIGAGDVKQGLRVLRMPTHCDAYVQRTLEWNRWVDTAANVKCRVANALSTVRHGLQ